MNCRETSHNLNKSICFDPLSYFWPWSRFEHFKFRHHLTDTSSYSQEINENNEILTLCIIYCVSIRSVVNTDVSCNSQIYKTERYDHWMCFWYSRSLGPVSVSLCDRYDMMLSSMLSLFILFQRLNFHSHLKLRQSSLLSCHVLLQNRPSEQYRPPQKWAAIAIMAREWEHLKK